MIKRVIKQTECRSVQQVAPGLESIPGNLRAKVYSDSQGLSNPRHDRTCACSLPPLCESLRIIASSKVVVLTNTQKWMDVQGAWCDDATWDRASTVRARQVHPCCIQTSSALVGLICASSFPLSFPFLLLFIYFAWFFPGPHRSSQCPCASSLFGCQHHTYTHGCLPGMHSAWPKNPRYQNWQGEWHRRELK
jgi:hypothetical protein